MNELDNARFVEKCAFAVNLLFDFALRVTINELSKLRRKHMTVGDNEENVPVIVCGHELLYCG
jgi:hypothetical protein